MMLGKIVKSNSHTDYVCHIYGYGEVEKPPAKEEYAFGTFVQIGLGDDQWLIGVIYDTVLFNPDFGSLGPRLSPESELSVFAPDYLNEKAVLVGVTAIGMIDLSSGIITQGVPLLAANTDALAENLEDEDIRKFHNGNPDIELGYAPLLILHNPPLGHFLLRTIIKHLKNLFPERCDLLCVLEDDLEWKSQISPLGGIS
ncbi:MAG: hypothetical protein MUO76_07510 [Anaerolineaceae bacterium]|nr:hypothetical protein [Anaerolineaceae bacterium]